MVKAKNKKLGKGLAALISNSKKPPKNIAKKNKEEDEEEQEEVETQKRTREKDKKKQKESKGDKDPRSVYEGMLAKKRKQREVFYKERSQDIDPNMEVWPEEEYTAEIDYDFFKRNKEGSAQERYKKLLERIKK